MRRLRLPASLQGRLLLSVLGLVALVWLGAAFATWRDARHELDELLDSHLAQAAALLVAQHIREPDDDRERAAPRRGLQAPQLHRYAPKVAFQVWHEGRLVLQSANAPAAVLSRRGLQGRDGFETTQWQGQRWRVFATRGAENDVRVFVGERMDSRAEILEATLHGLLMPLALALPLLALAVWITVGLATAPLRRLGRALEARPAQALQPLPTAGAAAELRPMLQALNGLFERVQRLLESERRFTADAAHELRTPIAAIRTQAQVALGETDRARREHALAATLEGCDRAARLVDQLLTLARLESGQQPHGESVDLALLARQVAAALAPAMLQRSQTLALEGESCLPAPGNEALLAVLLRNLLDNASRYAPAGARIELHLTREHGLPLLRVEDGGPGLTEAELARLGERFFRAPGNAASGSGLGWSIVHRVATALDLQVQAGRSAHLGGLAVTVRWRRAT